MTRKMRTMWMASIQACNSGPNSVSWNRKNYWFSCVRNSSHNSTFVRTFPLCKASTTFVSTQNIGCSITRKCLCKSKFPRIRSRSPRWIFPMNQTILTSKRWTILRMPKTIKFKVKEGNSPKMNLSSTKITKAFLGKTQTRLCWPKLWKRQKMMDKWQ